MQYPCGGRGGGSGSSQVCCHGLRVIGWLLRAGEEDWTAGAAEEEDVCGGCSIEKGRMCCRGRRCMLVVVGRLLAVRKVG